MICITGAGGTVGKEIVKHLNELNIPFVAAYHSDRKAKEASIKGINSAVIDYNSQESLISVFQNCDKVFLLGPNVENQTELEINVVNAAKLSSVKHIIKLSSTNAHKESYSIGKIHRAVEKALEKSGIDWTFLRCNQFMQNLVTYASETIKVENAIYSASSDAKISQLDVRDIAKVLSKIIIEDNKHMNKVYSLTGPTSFTYDEIAHEISKVLKRKINHINLSPEEFKGGLIAEGISEKIANRLTDLERYFREGEPGVVCNDIQKITGEQPRDYVSFVKEFGSLGVWDTKK